MTIIPAAIGVKLMFLMGFSNLVFLALVLTTCRCMSKTFVNALFKYEWYQKYYGKHCYYWWGFVISVAIHATLGFLVFGWPF